MNLVSQLVALRNQNRDLPIYERAEHACRLAKQLEKAGKYEFAAEALQEFWPEPSEQPTLDALDPEVKA